MPGGSQGFLSMAFGSGVVVGGVLIVLFLCSVVCWAVVVFKHLSLRRAAKQNNEFMTIFSDASSIGAVDAQIDHLAHSPLAHVFRAGYDEWQKNALPPDEERRSSKRRKEDIEIPRGTEHSVERSLRRASDTETARLERMLIFLATVASAAPFIGLFGTVWGIMESFRDIGATGTANLAVVAPGISEALIATATGLAAAIPAVVAYNYFNNSIRVHATEIEAFIAEFLNIVGRGDQHPASGKGK